MTRTIQVRTLLLMLALTALPGCASILGGGSNQAVTFLSTPTSATYTIVSSSGIQMGQGATPGSINLSRKNEYQIEISLDGYQTQTVALTRGTNGWIWGNLVFGWILGFAVDFLTGSAYKLEPALVQVTLQQSGEDTFAVVQLMDDANHLISVQRLRMIPDRPAGTP